MTADSTWGVRNMPPEARARAAEMAGVLGVTLAQYLRQLIDRDYDRRAGLRRVVATARGRGQGQTADQAISRAASRARP